MRRIDPGLTPLLLSGIGSRTAEIGQDRELGLVHFEAGLQPPLDVPGPGEGPRREPQGYGGVDGAPEPNEVVAKPQAGGGGNDAGLENDAEPAGDDDGRASEVMKMLTTLAP